MTRQPAIRYFSDFEAMSREAAGFCKRILVRARENYGQASIALAGGATPRRLYELLATEEFARKVPWDRICFFLGR